MFPYLLDAHRLPDAQLPLALEGVQVPELGGVRRRGDGVAARAVDRDGGDGPLVTPHPADQLLGVCPAETQHNSIMFYLQVATIINLQRQRHL